MKESVGKQVLAEVPAEESVVGFVGKRALALALQGVEALDGKKKN